MERPDVSSVSRVGMAAVAAILLLSWTPAAGQTPAIPPNGLGLDLELSAGEAAARAAGARIQDPDPNAPPLAVRIGVPWSLVEPAPGEYRWELLDPLVDAAVAAGRAIILNLHGGNPLYATTGGGEAGIPGPEDDRALSAWSGCLMSLAGRYGDRVRHYQVGRDPDREGERSPEAAARDYAFLFKQSAVSLRAANPDALVALASLDPASVEFAGTLFQEEIAAYADVVALSWNPSEEGRAGLGQIKGLLLVKDPSARLWITGVQLLLGLEGYSGLLRGYMTALEQEAALITFADPPDDEGRPFHLATMIRAGALFDQTYAPLVESGRGVRILTAEGSALPQGRAPRFFSSEEKRVLMPYHGSPGVRPGEYAVFVLDTVDVADPVLHDIAAGETNPNVAIQKDPETGLSRVALPLAPYPLVLSYRRFTTPEYAGEEERLDVTGERIPSAEEIIARHQAAQAAQDALLISVRAEAEETWHFSVGTSGSFDVTFKETFFLDPNVGAEWEQKEVYVNGVRWKMQTIPELPLVVSEKASTLPLVINLTREYEYRYEGRDDVEGRDCYVVSYRPAEGTEKLARGKAWIDTKTYMKVRVSQVQEDLPEPLVSNDQRDTYAPVAGPDGFTYWVLSRVDAQQVYSTVGRSFVLNKEVTLGEFVINGGDFVERRDQALASSNTMLRDTDQGLRYLRRSSDGTREVKNEVAHRNLFLLGGVFYNRAVDFPVPLAGVNFFDSDLFGRGMQTNVFFAGPLLFGSLSDPSLFGSRFDVNLDLGATAISFTDRLVREGRDGEPAEVEAEEITTKTQSLALGVSYPFAKFFRIKAETGLQYVDYGRTDETEEEFVTPRDTYLRSETLSGEFNRRALSLSFSQSWFRRQRHDPWGIEPSDFLPEGQDYARFRGTLSKEFYLPLNQKLRLSISGMGGRDLDRFSKYRFGFFDNRVRGFSGSGVHFTNGGIGNISYAFNLGNVIRFGAVVQHARVKDRQLEDEFRDLTGVGLSGQIVGKWGLIYRLDWGIAASSEIDDFQGEQEVLFSVLKLFSQR